MQFHAISNFGFAFGLQTVFMLSFFCSLTCALCINPFRGVHVPNGLCCQGTVCARLAGSRSQGRSLAGPSAMFHAGRCSKMVPFFKILFFPLLFSFPKSIGKEVAFKTQVTNFNPESATQASGKDAPLELDNETCLKHTRFWLHIFDCLNTYLRI